jgi:hypothetical protein
VLTVPPTDLVTATTTTPTEPFIRLLSTGPIWSTPGTFLVYS